MLAWIRSRPSRRPAPVVAIDGLGGAGKSTLADALAALGSDVAIVRMDDFFLPSALRRPDLAIGGYFDLERVHRDVLAPLARGEVARYRRYDWATDRLAEEHQVELAGPVLLEGVYSSVSRFADAVDSRIWVDCPHELRLQRALERDGEHMLDAWINDWMPAEDHYLAVEHPDERADLRIDGTNAEAWMALYQRDPESG